MFKANLLNGKIKRKNWLLKKITSDRIVGISLAPFGIYLRDDVFDSGDSIVINHERIHWKQQIEMLIVFFYIIYVVEWGVRLVFNRNLVYENISFEKEAYQMERDLHYLKRRKLFSWLKYLFHKT